MQNYLFLCLLDLGMGKHTKPDYFFLEISKGGNFQIILTLWLKIIQLN